MIKVTSYCLVIFMSLGLAAQNDKLEDLFNKAFHSRTSVDSGVYHARQALTLAQELRYETGVQISKMYAGLTYYNSNEIDTATILLYDALPFLEEREFEAGLAHWYIGKIHSRTRNFEEATSHYKQAMEAFGKTDSSGFLGNVYTSLGVIEGMQSKYVGALDWFIKAYELKLASGKELETATELNNIGIVYMRMGSHDMAKEYYWKAINLRDDDNDGRNYANLGGVYNITQQSDSAIFYYTKSYDLAVESRDFASSINSVTNLCNVLYQRGEHKEAIQRLKKSLKLTEDIPGSWSGIITELGKNYQKLNQNDSAIYYLKLGYQMSKKSKSMNWSKESSTWLGYLFADQNQYDSAFHYITESLAYRDSINNDRIQEIFLNQRVRLETKEKEDQIANLQLENELKGYRQRTLIGGVISLLLIGIFAFMNFRNRSLLKQKKLSEENDTLQIKLTEKQAALSSHTLSMIHRKNGMDDIAQYIDKLEGRDKQKIRSIINVNNALEKDWDNFQKYFSQVHSSFFEKLRQKNPDLTQNEVRLCALILMDLANKEIATLLNIEAKSVRMAKYRMRKKMELEQDEDLNIYLKSLE